MKNERDLERIVKGFANHRRIQVMRLLARQPGLSLDAISVRLGIEMKTASEHVRRLALAGLVTKRSEGRWVRHCLTACGENTLTFLRTLEHPAA